MIEMPLNVAKSLFFSNVLYGKLIGEEKALLIYLSILERLYSTTSWRYFPSFPQIDKYLMTKASGENQLDNVWVKGLLKNAGSFVLLSGCEALALGLVIPRGKNWRRGYGPRRKVFLRKPRSDRNLLKVLLGSDTVNNLFESTPLFLSYC